MWCDNVHDVYSITCNENETFSHQQIVVLLPWLVEEQSQLSQLRVNNSFYMTQRCPHMHVMSHAYSSRKLSTSSMLKSLSPPLSVSLILTKFPNKFPPLYTNMVGMPWAMKSLLICTLCAWTRTNLTCVQKWRSKNKVTVGYYIQWDNFWPFELDTDWPSENPDNAGCGYFPKQWTV